MASSKKLLQREPRPQCGGNNVFTGAVIALGDGNTEALAEGASKTKAFNDALAEYNRDIGRTCPGCTKTDNSGSVKPTAANTKKIENFKVNDTTWISFHVAKYKVSLGCEGTRPANRGSAQIAASQAPLIYSSGNPRCGNDEADNVQLYAGCVLSKAISSQLRKARDDAKTAAIKQAKADRVKILDTKECPKRCCPGTATLIPITIVEERILKSRISQSKRTRYVAYATAYWSVRVTCSKP